MDLQHARTLLERINRVFDDFGRGEAAPSALERDLLKEYVRRFYESLADETASNYRNGGRPKQKSPEAAPELGDAPPHTPSRRPLSGRNLRDTSSRPAAPSASPASPGKVVPAVAPPTIATTGAAPAAKPAIVHVPDSVEADVRKIEGRVPTPLAPVATAGTSATPAAPPSVGTGGERLSDLEPALRELFAPERGTDLGDRLGNAPIPDLTRALALNQRLVFQNQLFGKDADALRDTLTEVNNKDGYGEAALSLVTTARKYDWTDDERRGPARDFVKLVQRRYARA